MKKPLSLFLLSGLLALFSSFSAQAVVLGIVPPSQAVSVGDPVSVDLGISGLGNYGPESLGAFDLDITYDPSILSFNNISFGLLLGDPLWDEAETGFDDSIGTVNIFEWSYLEAASSSCIFCMPPYLDDLQPSSFTLATLTFDTLAPGTTSLAISVNALGDARGDPLGDVALMSGSLTVTAVPEPGALLILGSGLAGLALSRRRKIQRFKMAA